MNHLNLACLGLVCASFFVTSYADSPLCQNQISMQLQEEGWVSSDTAQVTVSVQVATNQDNTSVVMSEVTNKLKKSIKLPVEWRLVDLSTEKSSAGLFAISAKMSARLNSANLASLRNALDALSKAGEQYKIESIDYQPTLTEVSKENTRLRELLYKDVLEQQQLINTAFADKRYQLFALNFDSSYVNSSRPTMMYATNGLGASRQVHVSASTPFSQQVILTANVTFSSPNANCEQVK